MANANLAFRRSGCTSWFPGDTKPPHVGWYDRLFTDGVFRHYWDGYLWLLDVNGLEHWRQVGDYPCWRGATKQFPSSRPLH